MRAAYADPPYVGQVSRHYARDKGAAEVDHAELIAELARFDGWALSCSSTSLRHLLPLVPPETRVCAWVKPWASWKPNQGLPYAWEPVLVQPARMRSERRMPDWVMANMTLGRGVHGAKPEEFCHWVFAILGLAPGDELVDLYPGSGAVGEAFGRWCRQTVIAYQAPPSGGRKRRRQREALL